MEAPHGPTVFDDCHDYTGLLASIVNTEKVHKPPTTAASVVDRLDSAYPASDPSKCGHPVTGEAPNSEHVPTAAGGSRKFSNTTLADLHSPDAVPIDPVLKPRFRNIGSISAIHSDVLPPDILHEFSKAGLQLPIDINTNAHHIRGTCYVDCGASHQSYMSKTFYDAHKQLLQSHTHADDTAFTLADSSPGRGGARVDGVAITITGPSGTKHTIQSASFVVADKLQHDVYVGFPHLMFRVPHLLTEIAEHSQTKYGAHLLPDAPLPTVAELNTPSMNLEFDWESRVQLPDNELDRPEEEDLVEELPNMFPEELLPNSNAKSVYVERVQASLESLRTSDDPHITDAIVDKLKELFLSEAGLGSYINTKMEGVKDANGNYVYVTLQFDPKMKRHHYTPARNVPEPVRGHFKKVIDDYVDMEVIIQDGNCTHVCATVIAPKKTPPFIRIAVDFNPINTDLIIGQAHMPDIREAMATLRGCQYFSEVDMLTAFHQLRLSNQTSAMCGINTIFGVYRPLFMWEGVAPASAVLQNYLMSVWKDVPYVLQIHDNFVI